MGEGGGIVYLFLLAPSDEHAVAQIHTPEQRAQDHEYLEPGPYEHHHPVSPTL